MTSPALPTHSKARLPLAASWAIALGTVLRSCDAESATLVRGPYLQLSTPQSITVVWKTDVPAGCGLSIGPVDGAPTTIAGDSGTTCAMAVGQLLPGAHYAYRPLADGVPIATESIFRADDPAQPFTFLVMGDSGSRDANQLAVRDRMLAVPADFVLSTGDMIYEAGQPQEFDPAFFTPYRELLRRLVFWPVVGNHDVATLGGQPWREAFFTPANNPQASEQYYSFDVGNAHVVVLDSNSTIGPGASQYQFLAADLAATDARWKFVAFHHTIYSSGLRHGSDLVRRGNLVPLFDQYAVDLVFMGHDHDYERTWPLRANQVVDAGSGTVYVTTGGGGRALNGVGQSVFTAYSEASFHFTRVAVDGDSLLLEMIRQDGTVGDVMPLAKSGATTTTTIPPPTATLVFSPTADAYVDAGTAGTNYGTATIMTADASPASIALLRFVVGGIGARTVTRATLRVAVNSAASAESASGGSVHAISNHGWQEGAVTYQSRPSVDGPVLATQGAVALGQVVDFNVGAAVRQDGTYDFAIDSQSTDGVRYVTREGTTGRPQLIVVASLEATTTSTSTSTTSPASTTSATVSTTMPTTTTITTTTKPPTTTTVTTQTTSPPTTLPTTTTTTTSLPPSTTVLDVRVRASADDAEESSSRSVNLTSTDLELVNDGNDQRIGMRFTGIAIPKGAIIVEAWIQLRVDEATSTTTNLTIRGEDADNAAAFTTATGNISARRTTTASVSWAPAAWPTVDAAGAAQRTPALASLVQAIVNRSGWASGRALAFIISGTGKRVADSFDGNASGAPLLHVVYRTGS